LRLLLTKSRFWERFAKQPLNERQAKVLNRLLGGFDGKLTSSKWQSSPRPRRTQLTATSWIVQRGALRKDEGGGRSTSYSLLIE
jgi:Fic family protein